MANRSREEYPIEQLNETQRYLGEETIEEYQAGQMTRRRMLRRLVLICGSGAAAATLLAACGESTATVSTASTVAPTTSATMAPATTMPTMAPATTAASAGGTMTAPAGSAAPAGSPPPAATPSAAKGPLTVAENDPAVTGSMTTYQSDTAIKAYLARPKAEGSYPGIVVIHENRGLTPHIMDVARRFAKLGYIAIAPDLASRAGGTDTVPTDQVTGYFANAKPEELLKDLNMAVDFLEKQAGIKAGKFGVTGFCFGGGLTLRLAANNPKITSAAGYYGTPPTPVTQMSNTKAAILMNYGGLDARVNGTIAELEKTLTDSGKTFKKVIYDGANHAFNNDTGANFNENAAVAAWKETTAWHEKNLKS